MTEPDGIILIDKPAGITSHDVVAAVRKVAGTKKVGHAGTLDPAATGLLPILIGRGTKISQYMLGATKRYIAGVEFGVRTDTMDRDGEVTERSEDVPTREVVTEALGGFRGKLQQTPPMYSAKRHKGRKLYELARVGVEVEREPKDVEFFENELVAWELPVATLSVHCSSGTYIRVLADDLGQKLGCGAYLNSLRRTAVGKLRIEDAIELAALQETPGLLEDYLKPLAQGLPELPSIEVPKHLQTRLANGAQVSVDDLRHLNQVVELKPDERAKLLGAEGELLGIVSALIDTSDLERYQRELQALRTERIIARQC